MICAVYWLSSPSSIASIFQIDVKISSEKVLLTPNRFLRPPLTQLLFPAVDPGWHFRQFRFAKLLDCLARAT